jgi:hypothetical protein
LNDSISPVEALARLDRRARRAGYKRRVCVQCGGPGLDVCYTVHLRRLPEEIQKRYIEEHHLARKKADSLTVPVCPTCHEIIDLKQYDWRNEAQDPTCPRERRAARMLGLADLMEERIKVDAKIVTMLRSMAAEELDELPS